MMMLTYGVTDELAVMVMANYQAGEMSMLMDMGMGASPSVPSAPLSGGCAWLSTTRVKSEGGTPRSRSC